MSKQTKVAKNEMNTNNTVCWLQITEEDLDSIKPGSALAKKLMETVLNQESKWRPAYINAVERLIINPDLLVFEDAPITEPAEDDNGEDGAYVMCWQFIPHAAVIPPKPDTPKEAQDSLERIKRVSSLVE